MRLAFLPLVAATFLAAPQPASATAYCNVLKGHDGFVALRAAPDADARLVARMKADDEVQLLEGTKGRWVEVLHWHGDDRLDPGKRGNARKGWVHKRYISECG